MADFTTNKVDGNQVTAAEWNQLADIDNAVISSDQTPATGDLNQLAKAMAVYAGQAGVFCTDSGAADAYVATQISPLKAPPVATLKIGTEVVFLPAFNCTGGAVTLNAFAHGVKSVKLEDGTTNPPFRAISTGHYCRVIWDGTLWRLAGSFAAPTVQNFTSGSGTYTTPANVKYIRVRMVGAGGGGAGSGTSGGTGGTGGNTTFGTTLLVANGGVGGVNNTVRGGAGGTASLGTGPIGLAQVGGYGLCPYSTATVGAYAMGGAGANSFYGGAGAGAGSSNATTGYAAETNSGSGGGGGGGNATTTFGGAGGGSGGFVDALIGAPLATYAYAVGAAGAAGSAGTNGYVGGAGGSGRIEVTEYYY